MKTLKRSTNLTKRKRIRELSRITLIVALFLLLSPRLKALTNQNTQYTFSHDELVSLSVKLSNYTILSNLVELQKSRISIMDNTHSINSNLIIHYKDIIKNKQSLSFMDYVQLITLFLSAALVIML